MTELSKKDQLYELVRANPFISQQDLADQLRLSRSAVAGHIAGLIRERRLLGRAYVLPERRPIVCLGAANLDRKLRSLAALRMGTSNPARQDESFGGVARNIAENLARLGAPVALITAVGDDASGAALLAHAEGAGIDTRAALHLAGVCSGTYTAVLDEHGEMMLALADMALYDALTPEFIATRQPQRAGAALTVADLNLPHDTI
ncbi:MAG: PfkB family carbohydrate kinase, partial [Telluria sp.]